MSLYSKLWKAIDPLVPDEAVVSAARGLKKAFKPSTGPVDPGQRSFIGNLLGLPNAVLRSAYRDLEANHPPPAPPLPPPLLEGQNYVGRFSPYGQLDYDDPFMFGRSR